MCTNNTVGHEFDLEIIANWVVLYNFEKDKNFNLLVEQKF